MLVNDLLNKLSSSIHTLTHGLKNHQLDDGGFRGYLITDTSSGIWTTAEILHIVCKYNQNLIDETWLSSAANYLIKNQNKDGGWGFREGGKSITDITAWCILALHHFKCKEEILKGINFILEARTNIKDEDNGGWGLTNFEPDRIYSTWISSNCLIKITSTNPDWFDKTQINNCILAVKEAHHWILTSKNKDGGWGSLGGNKSNITSTAITLLNIFSQGEDPRKHIDSFRYLTEHMTDGIWQMEREIVVTQEGYELTQEWFTSIYCFRAFIFFAELNICSFDQMYNTYLSVDNLIENQKVRSFKNSTDELLWTIPLMIDGLEKFRSFILNNKNDFESFLERKKLEIIKKKKTEIENKLKTHFPYPISQVYFSLSHEIDYHRRFQYLIQANEVIIRYAAFVLISSVIASSEKIETLKSAVENKIKKPSLGDFANILITVLNGSQNVQNIISPYTKEDLTKKAPSHLFPEQPKTNLTQLLSEIVALRNSWAGHGAVRSVYEYKKEIENQLPNLFTLLNRFSFLAECNSFLILSSDYNEFGDGDIYKIRVFNGLDISDDDLEIQKRLSEGQKDDLIRYVYFHNTKSNYIVNLYPFISHMICTTCKKERFFFYNGIRSSDKISYLSFECGHTTEYGNMSHFVKRFGAIGVNFSGS